MQPLGWPGAHDGEFVRGVGSLVVNYKEPRNVFRYISVETCSLRTRRIWSRLLYSLYGVQSRLGVLYVSGWC